MDAIKNAKDALAKVREANKVAEANAVQAIEDAVAETFVHGAKVITKDRVKKGEVVKGVEYTVDFVKGVNVIVTGKGNRPKVFGYEDLTVIG